MFFCITLGESRGFFLSQHTHRRGSDPFCSAFVIQCKTNLTLRRQVITGKFINKVLTKTIWLTNITIINLYSKTKIMTNEVIKKEVREIVQSHLDTCINYEWEGTDFNFRVLEQCVDQNEELFNDVVIDTKEPSVQFDYELYKKFIDHVTEFVCSGFSVKKQNDYV